MLKEPNLPEKIISYRALHGISQTEFARRCGVSLQTINQIENRRQSPSRLTLAKISQVIEEGVY